MTSPITLWTPRPPDNANARDHWAVANRKKRAFTKELDLRLQIKLLPPPPDYPLERVELLVEWHYPNRRNLLDDDNAIRRCKPIVDFLVRNRYLAGDTSGHLHWRKVVTVIGASTPPCSTVRLTLIPLDP